MDEEIYCDFCGRTALDVPPAPPGDRTPALDQDEDGLWVCRVCRGRIVTPPVGDEIALNLPDELRALIGKSAGVICLGLNAPAEPPYLEVLEDATRLHDRYMSEWTFMSQWPDGTTVWRDPDGLLLGLATRDGGILRVSRE